MIIVQLTGGFGNQLFQYAAGISLSEHHKVQVKIDISQLLQPDVVTRTTRKADIFNLARPPEVASKREISPFINQSLPHQLLDKSRPFYKRKVYKEASNLFDKNFFKAGDNLLLKGNRQSEKYFKRYESIIRNAFFLSESCFNSVRFLGERLQKECSSSIHIRRGDYLTPIALDWLGLLPLSYYTDAVARMVDENNDCKFYIFSDDIEWAKTNLHIAYPHEFVSSLITKSSMEDFYLMSCCRHNIIANSTYSWWAAWLNSYPGKLVIAPKRWYNRVEIDTSDLIPDEWIRL